MNRSQRRTHRVVWTGLALFFVVVTIFAIQWQVRDTKVTTEAENTP